MGNLKRLPLSAFDPRIRALIERGCVESVEIKCESVKRANNFRNVLVTFRARLKHERRAEPHLWEPLYQTIISVKPGHPDTIWLRPRRWEFDRLLEGVTLPDTEAPVLLHDPLAELEKEPDK